jgi:hypothetical protein
MSSPSWPGDYLQKRTLPQEAIRRIQSGQRVFIWTAGRERQGLVKESTSQTHRFADLENMWLFSQEVPRLGDKPTFFTSHQGKRK